MTFRFYLQPTMAAIAAVADGIRDVRLGHKSFFWSVTARSGAARRPLARRTDRDRPRRAARPQHGCDLPVQGPRPFLSGRGADDGDPARGHSLFHLPVDRRTRRRAGGSRARRRPDWRRAWTRSIRKSNSDEISVELSARRTGMSFQRTRMSADRTLMSVIRTSLSLISFGFTIFQVFEKLRDQSLLTGAAPARNFGVALVSLGIAMLVIGIVYHVQFMLGLRDERKEMTARRPDPRREQIPAVAHADHGGDPAADRRLRHRQHDLPGRTVRLRSNDRLREVCNRIKLQAGGVSAWPRHRKPTSRTSSSSGATISVSRI